MAWLTVEDLKGYLRNETASSTPSANTDQTVLQAVLDAAHQGIRDQTCSDFEAAGDAATARTIEADQLRDCGRRLLIPFCTEVTSVVGSSTLTANTDYRVVASRQVNGQVWPYDTIVGASVLSGDSTWGYFTVTAKWGWAATPYPIIEATRILAKDILSNRDVRFGLVGWDPTNDIVAGMRRNPYVMDVIDRYRGPGSWGVA